MTVTTAVGANANTLVQAAKAATPTGADFNMFLKLLTTQMQNQDPLDPMKTSEYTQQLAQYSQIEQTVQQSTTLKDILTQLSAQDMTQASGLIGRSALFASNVSGVTAAVPASWSYTADRPVASLTATITDSAGKIVDSHPLAIDGVTGTLDWSGTKADGRRAADGGYTLALTGIDSNGNSVPVAIRSSGKVSGVTSANGTTSLEVNGITLPASALVRVVAS